MELFPEGVSENWFPWVPPEMEEQLERKAMKWQLGEQQTGAGCQMAFLHSGVKRQEELESWMSQAAYWKTTRDQWKRHG